jgi:Ca-activated chloride channel family protein
LNGKRSVQIDFRDRDLARKAKLFVLLLLLFGFPLIACSLFSSDDIPSNAVVLNVQANSGLKVWLEEMVEEFNDSRTKTDANKPIYVELTSKDAGRSITEMTSGDEPPSLWVPDDTVWVDVLEAEGVSAFAGDCVSIVESPLIIAMWRPVAESLGWPGRELGWLDVGSLAADPSAWQYYSGGQFGPSLRLGHTHPGLSGTGAATLLAVVQAAQSKTTAVSVDEIQQPIVQASVGAFEGAVSWFSNNTDTLGETMRDRGINFLGAAIMYESTAVYYGNQHPGIVPVYPFEGTYMAKFPACINQSADADVIEAATIFREFLLDNPAQENALVKGFRPVNDQVELDDPADALQGVDLDQPKIVFEAPSVDAIYAVQDLWQAARKNVNLVMLLDVSGSMDGSKLRAVQESAVQFIRQMGDDDFFTLITFSNQPEILTQYSKISQSRDFLDPLIRSLEANGDTQLYDAIGEAAALISRTTTSEMTNAIIVLTDGMDTASTRYSFNQQLIEVAIANNTTIFAIAYGSDANETLLADLAFQANGNFYLGDEAGIAEIYQEMSAAFGGSVGVGR